MAFLSALVRLGAWLSAVSAVATPLAAAPHIVLLATGGTISSSTGGGRTGQQLLAQLHLGDGAQVEVKDVADTGSSDLTRADWGRLVAAIRKALADPGVSGVVVTHGTDTMEETAFLLDLVIDDPRPLVITGSMRSSDAVSADGPGNLVEAIRVAADPQARGLGTLVVLDDVIHSGVAIAKSDTNRLSAFQSVNTGPLGVISENKPHFLAKPFKTHRHWMLTPEQIATFPRVETVPAEFDGDDLLLKAAVAGGAKAIVIAGFGSGTVTASVRRFIAAYGSKVPLILSSRVGAGFVKDAYQGPTEAGAFTVVRSARLNPAKARVLAMVALAAQVPIDQALFDGF